MGLLKPFLDPSYITYLRYSDNDGVYNYVTSLLREAFENEDQLFVNMLVIDEAIWILTNKYEIPLSEAKLLN